ncbi:DsbC family protein [Xenorhabdus sp. KJ12.1]|uniref:DsbC family protein n=1 Tax=Xenorhabdus sp. KJ12.1 TaxID=1851571 RepID=UPI000C0472FE|nr:DsbC family protein [Xenorhabdus sp. KJ12.1]PHM72190.1 DsbC protein [Xenorhabdus sp. KJ12.1]
MSFQKCFLTISLLAGFVTHAFAGTGSSTDTVFTENALKAAPKNSIQPKRFVVPTNGLIALDIDDNLNVMTSNGRFVLKGYLYDTWAKKSLNNFEEVTKYASIIPLKELNLKVADLQPAVWGNGPEQVMIFTDPNCTYCHAVLKELADLDPKKYSVNVISLGALGEESKKRNQELYCASDRYRADRAIISGDSTTKFEQVKDCDQTSMIRRNITAQVLGVSMVPFIIRHDGNYSIGKPAQGLKAYLESK